VQGDERIRLFCGLQLPPEAVAMLVSWQQAHLTGGRPAEHRRVVPPGNLHVTLAFLGHRPVAEVTVVAAELGAAGAAAGPIELRAVSYRETRSVGMVVFDDVGGAAGALADDLQARLERLGILRRERRPWLPHITVVRFRERAGLAPAPPNTCSIRVVRSALYRSLPGPGGARYESLATAALGGQ
jgi:RNA 2',3'-cyclic 3'-phosphodiesterase